MDSKQVGASLWQYFFDIPSDCPYGLGFTAVYRQALFGPVPDQAMDSFLASGFRRNGNTLYTMACHDCRACVPIRLNPEEFRPNRNQRRVWNRNQDLTARRGPLKIDQKRLGLCDRFLRQRYAGKDNTAIDYYSGFFMNTITNTFEITYHHEEQLIGAAIVDMTQKSLNAVYFYFDPAAGKRSPGTWNILYLLDLARRYGIRYVYLGYWIAGVPAMSYKANFKPHSLLRGSGWEHVVR